MNLVKERISDMREIKELLLLEIKKGRNLSDRGENLVNGDEKRKEKDNTNKESNKEEVVPLHL